MFSALVVEKLLLGVTLAAPIGPVSIEMIRRGLQNGFWSAMNIRLGSTIGHLLCLLMAYYALSSSHANQYVISSLAFMGAVFLIYMGVKNIINAVELNITKDNAMKASLMNSLWLGFILALVNPVSVVFWVGIFATSMIHTSGEGLVYNFLIMAGVLGWGILLCSVLTFSRKVLPKNFIKVVAFVANIAMVIFGIKYGYQALLAF